MTSEQRRQGLKVVKAWRDGDLRPKPVPVLEVLDVTLYVLYFMGKLEERR